MCWPMGKSKKESDSDCSRVFLQRGGTPSSLRMYYHHSRSPMRTYEHLTQQTRGTSLPAQRSSAPGAPQH